MKESQSKARVRNMLDIVPIYSPRTSYKQIKSTDDHMIADMTLNFDKLTIKLLKQQFLLKQNSLDLQQFIIIAKKHLKFWQVGVPNREISVVRYLTYLFNQIDINGNGDMEWDQFTNYVIEKATVLKNLKTKADQVKHYVKSQLPMNMRIDTIIQKMEYLPDIDKVAYFQEGSNRINFFTLSTGQPFAKSIVLDSKNLIVNISSVKKQKNGKTSLRKKDLIIPTKVRILDMLYIAQPKYKILVISTSDGIVRGWRYHQGNFVRAPQPDNQQQLFEHSFNSQIYCLAWDGINEVLYCGQKNGNIYMWNLKTDLQKALYETQNMSSSIAKDMYQQASDNKNDCPEQKINNMITTMITMPKLQFMASGRMDGKLILWDTINNKKKWVYKEHVRGIITLAFNQTMILLFSAGFDHKICIWNPYISTLIHKIQGHLSPILSLKVIDNTHQLISMDSQGIVKITDTKRFHIVSSFSVDTSNAMGETSSQKHSSSSITCLLAISSPLKLIFGGKSISIYQYDKNYNPDSADQNTVVCCRYVKNLLCFFTPAGNKIKVWSALNGDVEKIYMDVTQNQISTFQFDFLLKRMIIGDSKGNITMHNTVNGAKMKTLAKHNGEVTHLISTQNDSNVDIFISCGVDNQIKIARQTQQSYEIIRTICLRKDITISCLKYIQDIKLIVVGTSVGSTAFYDIETGKNSGNVYSKPYQQITSICKTQLPLLLTCSSTGAILILGLPPLPTRFQKIISFQHYDEQKLNCILGIRCACYSFQERTIYVVDDKMWLTSYSFSQVFKEMEKTQYNKEKTEAERRNNIYRVFDAQQNSYPIIKKKWAVKAHNQVIKSVQYIQNQSLVITSSFDKRVKIWNSKTGEFIDSLQQNYSKREPQPIAYLDTRNNIIYSGDKKKALTNLKPQMSKMQFNPFYMNNLLMKQKGFTNDVSNRGWNVRIHFKELSLQEMKTFQDLYQRLDNKPEQQKTDENMAAQRKQKLMEIQLGLLEKRQLLRQINKENTSDMTSNLKNQFQRMQIQPIVSSSNIKKLSTNYFKKSMMKCIKNFIDKNQNNQLIQSLKLHTSQQKKRRPDFTPIYKMMNLGSQNKQQNHQLYIEELARKETQNIINGRKDEKVYLHKEGADKARKLCRLLINSDRNDPRPKILMKSIQIRDNHVKTNRLLDNKTERSFPRLA